MLAAVDVERAAAQEADERQSRPRRPGRRPACSAPRRPRAPGSPASVAFCTSSKLARPLTISTCPVSGSRPARSRPADHLVDRVVPAHVLPDAHQLAAGREQAGRVQARRWRRTPSAPPATCRAARSGPAASHGHRVGGDVVPRPHPHRVDARLAAHPARGGGVEVPGRIGAGRLARRAPAPRRPRCRCSARCRPAHSWAVTTSSGRADDALGHAGSRSPGRCRRPASAW